MKMLPKKDVGLTNQSFSFSDPTEVRIKPILGRDLKTQRTPQDKDTCREAKVLVSPI
jgi:hypothetical protein